MARARTPDLSGPNERAGIPGGAPAGSIPPQERTQADPHDDLSQELVTGEAVALDLRPTGFVLRAAGTIIDWVLYLGSYALAAIFGLPLVITALNLDNSAAAAVGIGALVLVLVVAPMTVELLTHGKSLGKLAVGGRIVRDDGGAIGFRHAFIRSLTGVLEIFMTFGGLAAIVALLNGKSKRLGDFIAGTYSQYERVSREVPAVHGVPVELLEWSRTADVGRMPDRVARRIASFLRQASRLTPATRAARSNELATEAMVWVSPVPDASDELFLAAVAAVRRDREAAALTLEAARLDSLKPALEGLPHGFPDRS